MPNDVTIIPLCNPASESTFAEFQRAVLTQIAARFAITYEELGREFVRVETPAAIDAPRSKMGFRVGDLVTRDGTDVHRVIEADWIDGYAPDLITVECVKEPLGFLDDDGSRSEPWARIGEIEMNLARRYSHAGEIVDVKAASTEVSSRIV
jgi:hypothetical protein